MKKHLLRVLCIAFVLFLCLPMAACDMEFGGLVGELLVGNTPDNVVPEQWESNVVIEDILPEIETAIDTVWDEDFSGDIAVEPYAPINIPVESWTVFGHCPEIVPNEGHERSSLIVAGGIEKGALLHQGSVGIGTFDLSKYEKMIVYYGIDSSDFSVENYERNPNNRIMVTTTKLQFINYPDEADILASTVYTLHGLQVLPIEIDLTDVDYHGPVYVTCDLLPGAFMIIGAIYLVPYAE